MIRYLLPLMLLVGCNRWIPKEENYGNCKRTDWTSRWLSFGVVRCEDDVSICYIGEFAMSCINK